MKHGSSTINVVDCEGKVEHIVSGIAPESPISVQLMSTNSKRGLLACLCLACQCLFAHCELSYFLLFLAFAQAI